MDHGIKGPGMSLQTHCCHGGPATPSSTGLYPSSGPLPCVPHCWTAAQTPFLSLQCHPETQPPLPFARTVWQVRCHGQAVLPLNASIPPWPALVAQNQAQGDFSIMTQYPHGKPQP